MDTNSTSGNTPANGNVYLRLWQERQQTRADLAERLRSVVDDMIRFLPASEIRQLLDQHGDRIRGK